MCFRATEAKSLNDPEEFKYAMRLLIESIQRYEKIQGISTSESRLPHIMGKEDLFQRVLPNYFGHPYIFSLCSDKDSLAMWRFYGNNGLGVALGLNIDEIMKYCGSLKEKFLSQCLYGKPTKS